MKTLGLAKVFRTGGRKRRRFFRHAGLAVVSVFAVAAASSATVVYADLVDVNLACDDGTSLDLTLDLASVQALDDATNAMLLYPAGMTCSVTQLPTGTTSVAARLGGFVTQAAASGNPEYEYSVGGGQAVIVTRCTQPGTLPPQSEEDNFSLNARVTPDMELTATGASGHVNLTIPQCMSSNTGLTYGPSDLRADVDCLTVHPGADGTEAQMTAYVEQATGVFGSAAEFPPAGLQGREISIANDDSGLPGGLGDAIGWDFGTAKSSCDPTGLAAAEVSESTVDHGNITNHDVS